VGQTKQWALTHLGEGTTLTLEVNGLKFDVSQFTSSFAVNEIPSAQILLAVGRNARTLEDAVIHSVFSKVKQMQPARVTLQLKGDWDTKGIQWPEDPFVIFEGYMVGLAYTKISGKIQVIANLRHWLIDLANSSCLAKNSHPANPWAMTSRAVMANGNLTGANLGKGNYIASMVWYKTTVDTVTADLWGAMKGLFCQLADVKAEPGVGDAKCSGAGTEAAVKNDRASNALKKIEGPGAKGTNAPNCDKAYVYGTPLKLDVASVPMATESVSRALSQGAVESYANTNFWDKMLGTFFPQFNMAIYPSVEFACVAADTPAYNGEPWKAITPDEYDSFQMQAELDRPLRAVGVISNYSGDYGLVQAGRYGSIPIVGGCFSATSVDASDGVVQYVSPPAWLAGIKDATDNVSGTSGIGNDKVTKTATTPNAKGVAGPDPKGDKLAKDVLDLFNRYAQSVYVANMLRGRTGLVGGKLRFDIGPGSIIIVKASEEKFLAGEDSLAMDLVGSVARVTIAINAESAQAQTTFSLSHVRTNTENSSTDGRTSVPVHPLFGSRVQAGMPLVPGHENLNRSDGNFGGDLGGSDVT